MLSRAGALSSNVKTAFKLRANRIVASRPNLNQFSIAVHDWPKDWIKRGEKWDDMDVSTQGLWEQLGWNASTWNGGQSPTCRQKNWKELNGAEQRAALALGYNNKLWDAEDKTLGMVAKKKPKRRNHYPAFDGPCWENPYTGYQ